LPSDSTNAPFYAPVETYLQQGDIFEAAIVTPLADLVPRLFRSTDGRHGSVVLTGGASGKIFSPAELNTTLRSLPSRTPLHTQAFEYTPDGHPELVVASAQLAEFFIVASQTCDICGEDKPAKELAVILRATPLRTLCMVDKLPLDGVDRPSLSIHEYLLRETGSDELKQAGNNNYTSVLRKEFSSWQPSEKAKKEFRSKIANTVRIMLSGNANLFFLKESPTHGFGDMSVDLTTIYTVPTRFLVEIAGLRKACLAESYRNKFAQEFGNRFARIAVPEPMVPDKLV